MSDVSDEELMHRVQQGDQRAFRKLVDQYLNPLYRFARRTLSNQADAEDVVQETWVKVWHHATQWQVGRAKVSTWLHSIVHHACVDFFRRQKLNQQETIDWERWEEETEATETSDAYGLTYQAELSTQVEQALQQLPESQRSALILCYYEGFSNQEAAKVLNVSIAALESLLARGRRKLKQQLQL